MTGFRYWGLTLLALTVVVQTGKSQEPAPSDWRVHWGKLEKPQVPTAGTRCILPTTNCVPAGTCIPCVPCCMPATVDSACAIYSLEALGDDPSLGQWVASTIPEVIEPGSWNKVGPSGRKQVLSYFAPKRILVVYHTPAVQAKVDAFLKEVKNATCKKEEKCVVRKDQGVVRASYTTPQTLTAAQPAGSQNYPYPVPAASRPPKHLFHFIIRYEGAGIIDDSVVKFLKTYNEKDVIEATANAKARGETVIESVPAIRVPKEACEERTVVSPEGKTVTPGELPSISAFKAPTEEKKEEKVKEDKEKEGDQPKPQTPDSDKCPDSDE